MISKEEVKRLANLARVEINEEETKSLAGDLEQILRYFEELKKLDTENVVPVTGGTENKNVFREDETGGEFQTEWLTKQFPEEKKGFLKIPKVFSNEE